ncbi:uncharacterized protein PSFLO_07077 [Pseudozyma flocculosa]|uniref:Uncharacterized protein n=1 Tax=Pseudozyma flocculosa TaxID=84751 RepID=A0A5C3FD37_9BASI|nr:uncharacterized protein PSFLO_07077 [Pseudozyma flocculosa]
MASRAASKEGGGEKQQQSGVFQRPPAQAAGPCEDLQPFPSPRRRVQHGRQLSLPLAWPFPCPLAPRLAWPGLASYPILSFVAPPVSHTLSALLGLFPKTTTSERVSIAMPEPSHPQQKHAEAAPGEPTDVAQATPPPWPAALAARMPACPSRRPEAGVKQGRDRQGDSAATCLLPPSARLYSASSFLRHFASSWTHAMERQADRSATETMHVASEGRRRSARMAAEQPAPAACLPSHRPLPRANPEREMKQEASIISWARLRIRRPSINT